MRLLPTVLAVFSTLLAALPAHGDDDGAWRELPPPPVRSMHAGVLDVARHRIVILGGVTEGLPQVTNSVHTFDLETGWWTNYWITGAPDSRRDHTVVYDPEADRLIMFGGWNGTTFLDDVWELRLGDMTWNELSPGGTGPGARAEHAAVYDPVGGRMLVLMGFDGASATSEVWALNLRGAPTWELLAPAGSPPAARHSHAAVYDAVEERIIMLGGWTQTATSEVWELRMSPAPSWHLMAPSGAAPPARKDLVAVLDPSRNRVLIGTGFGTDERDDLWALDLSGQGAWASLSPGSGPAPRRDAVAVVDPAADRLLLFGGHDPSILGGLWALPLSGNEPWVQLPPSGLPTHRQGHAVLLDRPRDRLLVIGGNHSQQVPNPIWSLSLDGLVEWTPLVPAGTVPAQIYHHAAVIGPDPDEAYVFGGYIPGQVTNQLWRLSLAEPMSWTEIVPLGTPPVARTAQAAAYAPDRQSLIVFGGSRPNGVGGTDILDDLWELTLNGTPTWQPIVADGEAPPGLLGAVAVYDPIGQRFIVFGGFKKVGTGGVEWPDDTWILDLSGAPLWSRLDSAFPDPPGRSSPTMVYDSRAHRVVLYGGTFPNIYSYRSDAWALDLTIPDRWVPLAPQGLEVAHAAHAAVYDGNDDRMIVIGTGQYNRVLEWNRHTGDVPPPVALAPRLGLPYPNPSRSAVAMSIRLSGEERVRARVVDVAGRAVRVIDAGIWSPGDWNLVWDGQTTDGARAAPGLYFIQVQLSGTSFQRRVVVIE